MAIYVGSARIDENGNISGGTAGDQTGNEVSTQAFYMHSKGWYSLRPKTVAHANALATAMSQACANNNIGYDQNERSGVVTNVKKYGTLSKISVKTEADCSSLVRACIWQATGTDVGDFYTGNEASVLEKSGLFETRRSVSSSADVCNGDVLVTKTKGHTVIAVSGRARSGSTSTTIKSVTATEGAQKGPDSSLAGTYTTTANLYIRNGAGESKTALTIIPKGTKVQCYGYYSVASGVKWLYIQVTLNGVKYTGFSSSAYLKK